MSILFRFFEKQVAPYPGQEPKVPPKGFFAFVWACTQGMRGWIGLMTLTSALLAAYEAVLFAIMGRVVPVNAGANLLTRLLDLERTYAQLNGSISEDIGNIGRAQRQVTELTLRKAQRVYLARFHSMSVIHASLLLSIEFVKSQNSL